MNDHELLTKFAETKSDAAFRALVERHLPLVFGTARRITRDAALAEDIAQTVFLLLAQKARDLSRESMLSGWFFRTTRFVSLRALRSEHRRKNRERIAVTMTPHNVSEPLWQRVSPELDEALAKLGETDRRALLLRFFEGQPLARVGESLGTTEEAAKKRVRRALEKLREILARRGVQISAAALAAGLAAEAIAAIPAALADKISASVPATLAAGIGVGGGWLLAEVLRAMQWGRIKIAAGAAVAMASALFVFQSVTHSRLPKAPIQHDFVSAVASSTNSALKQTRRAELADSIEINGQQVTLKTVRVTVLDESDDRPISAARVRPTFAVTGANDVLTDEHGVAVFQIPENLPELREHTQLQAAISAEGYSQRSIMWLSSTGGVFHTVTPAYTVRLARGVPISGFVVDDSNQPVERVKLDFLGNNYEGYSYSIGGDGKISSPPIVRAQDFSEYAFPSGAAFP